MYNYNINILPENKINANHKKYQIFKMTYIKELKEYSIFQSENGTTNYKYVENEGGLPIAILCGFNFPSAIYENFADKFERLGYSVLLFDYYGRGFSESSSNSSEYTPCSYSAQFIELCEHLKLENIIIVSCSFGSLVAAHILQSKPELIHRCILVSPFKVMLNPLRSFQRYILSHPRIGQYVLRWTTMFLTPSSVYEVIHDKNDGQMFWNLVSSILYQANNNPSYYHSVSKMLVHCDRDGINSAMDKYKMCVRKVLIIYGESDTVVDINSSCEWFKTSLASCKIVKIPNSGHYVFIEKPNEVIKHIVSFLHMR